MTTVLSAARAVRKRYFRYQNIRHQSARGLLSNSPLLNRLIRAGAEARAYYAAG